MLLLAATDSPVMMMVLPHTHTQIRISRPRGDSVAVWQCGGERSIGTIIHPFTPFSKPFGVFRRVGSFAVGCAFALPTAYHTLRVCDTKSIWRIRARRLPSSRDPQHTNVRKVNGRFKEAAESESKKKKYATTITTTIITGVS